MRELIRVYLLLNCYVLSICIEKTLGERLLGEGLRSKGDYVVWIGLGGSEGEVIEEVGDVEEVG